MNPLVSLRIARAALRLNAMRSFLAMLGVIIGVGSVIVMVAVASGASQAVEKQIQALGTNLLIVSPGSYSSGGRRSGSGTAVPLSQGDIDAITSKVSGIAAISGTVQGSAPMIAAGANWTTSISGDDVDFLEVRDWPLTEGGILRRPRFASPARS